MPLMAVTVTPASAPAPALSISILVYNLSTLSGSSPCTIGRSLLMTRSLTPQPQYASPIPYRPESVSILIRFQSHVPRTIMHLTSVILTFFRWAAAMRAYGPAKTLAAPAARRNWRRFIRLSVRPIQLTCIAQPESRDLSGNLPRSVADEVVPSLLMRLP